MTTTPKCLVESTQLPNTETLLYTAPGPYTLIDAVTVSNTSGATANVLLRVVASGGTAGTANTLANITVAANGTYLGPELVGQILNAGDFISALATPAAALVIRISGREITS